MRLRHALPSASLASLLALSACGPIEEEQLRTQLAQWFALGETLRFEAEQGCAAGVFRLRDTQVGSAMPVTRAVKRAAQLVTDRGRVAIDDPAISPDRSMVEMANLNRSLGMKMRRAGLEGRICMDEVIESAFRAAVTNPLAILAYDVGSGALILMDPEHDLLVVAIGEGS